MKNERLSYLICQAVIYNAYGCDVSERFKELIDREHSGEQSGVLKYLNLHHPLYRDIERNEPEMQLSTTWTHSQDTLPRSGAPVLFLACNDDLFLGHYNAEKQQWHGVSEKVSILMQSTFDVKWKYV